MWIIYVILAFLLLSIIAKVQEYNSQKKEKEERENRIRKNVQTGAFDCKKEIFRLSGNFWLVSFKISYLCLPLFYETRTTPSCHPSGCAYRQL